MEEAGTILSVSMPVAILGSLILGSRKSGYIAYSPQSLTDGSKPKFEVNKAKVGTFVTAIFASIIINSAFALIVAEGDAGVSILFSTFNTIFISYALAYWILLQKKKSKKERL